MSAGAAARSADVRSIHGCPTFGSLTSAEMLRLRSRRLVKLVLAFGLGVLLIAFVLIFLASGEPSATELAQAQQQAQSDRQACLDSVRADPQGPKTLEEFEEICGSGDASGYARMPFTWGTNYVDGILGVAAGFAVLLFLIGASAGGAEWSARTMPAVLYWEPRRVRVMAVKSLVVALTAVVVAASVQAVWLLMSWVLVSTRGPSEAESLPDLFLSGSVGGVGRGILVAVLAALSGFALANLTRNTGAALGVAFVYFAVAEPAVGFFSPRLVRWMPVTNVGGLLQPGGLEVPSGVTTGPTDGGGVAATVLISNVRGGIVLMLAVAVLLVLATALFSRRDVS